MLGQLLILPNNVTFSTHWLLDVQAEGSFSIGRPFFTVRLATWDMRMKLEMNFGQMYWCVPFELVRSRPPPPNVSFLNYQLRPQTPETPWNSKMAASLINSERHKICIIYKPPCLICVSLNQNCPASMCWCVALVFICAKYHTMHCLPAC